MMGLSYESEPIIDRLQNEYGEKIEFRNVMGLLVREDLSFARSLGIRSLPTYLLQYKGRAILMQSFDYQDFSEAITNLLHSGCQ